MPVWFLNYNSSFSLLLSLRINTFKKQNPYMKFILTLALAFAGFLSFSQSDDITIPENTMVSMELSQDIREGKNKLGEAARFVVSQDVSIDGVVVISKGTVVHASITLAKRGELRVDIYDVAATDGTVIKLRDCWIFTTAAQNLNSRGALIMKGTRKNCVTPSSYKVKKTGGKF
jgi:hypothetical protein